MKDCERKSVLFIYLFIMETIGGCGWPLISWNST